MNFGWVILGLVLLYYGAEWLVKGSSDLALKAGISPLVVGLTVVAFGTSAPELLVSVSANLKDPPQGDFALGNVVGSNICNLALVLGLAALIRPLSIHNQVLKREMPILLVATVVFVAMLWDGQVSRFEGILLVLGIIIYVVSSIIACRRGADLDFEVEELQEDLESVVNAGPGLVMKSLLLILVGLGGLVIGADRLVAGGGALALAWGVPEAVIALTLVAFSTSLPEVATTVVAALKGKGDLAVGSAVGSCIFNLLVVIGLTAIIAPLSSVDLQTVDLWVMAVSYTHLTLPTIYSV